jgi:hypothetical protein
MDYPTKKREKKEATDMRCYKHCKELQILPSIKRCPAIITKDGMRFQIRK